MTFTEKKIYHIQVDADAIYLGYEHAETFQACFRTEV
jgi:hypothetical protein